MRRSKSLLAVVVLVLPAATCSPVLTMFDVPASAQAGREFVVTVWGQDHASTSGGTVGCVLQVPLGISVTGHVAYQSGSSVVVRDDPAVLSLFSVEPGHFLASFHGFTSNSLSGVAIRMLAPASLPPGSQLKVAIVRLDGTGWSTAQSNFALIGGSQSRPITLVAEPPTMVEAQGLPILDFVAAGDVDGDGRDELLGLHNGGTEFWTCRWNGSSWTSTMFGLPATNLSWSCAPGDFDGDGNLDVALAGEVLFGDGLGGWTLGPTLPTGGGVKHVAVGDLDADGLADFVVTASDGSAFAYRSNGNRTFSPWSSALSTPTPGRLLQDQPRIADVTGDGFADLILQRVAAGGEALEVWAGNGAGTWTMAGLLQPHLHSQIAVGSLPAGAPTGIVAVDQSGGQMGLRVFTHQGGGSWTSAFHALAPGSADGVLLRDFDGDGVDDVVLNQTDSGLGSPASASLVAPRLRLFHTAAGPSFVEDTYSGLTSFGISPQLASGDFDGDGWPDLATADTIFGGAFAWLSTKLGAHAFGAGCGVGTIVPAIGALGAPQLGNAAFAVELAGLSPNTWGVLWLGFDNHLAAGSVPLPFLLDPFGAPGCTLLADPQVIRVLFVGAPGTATWPLPLPTSPAFHRAVLFAQGATLAPGANALGMLFSPGLALRID